MYICQCNVNAHAQWTNKWIIKKTPLLVNRVTQWCQTITRRNLSRLSLIRSKEMSMLGMRKKCQWWLFSYYEHYVCNHVRSCPACCVWSYTLVWQSSVDMPDLEKLACNLLNNFTLKIKSFIPQPIFSSSFAFWL